MKRDLLCFTVISLSWGLARFTDPPGLIAADICLWALALTMAARIWFQARVIQMQREREAVQKETIEIQGRIIKTQEGTLRNIAKTVPSLAWALRNADAETEKH